MKNTFKVENRGVVVPAWRCFCSYSALGERRPDGRHSPGEREAAHGPETDGKNQVSHRGMRSLLPHCHFPFSTLAFLTPPWLRHVLPSSFIWLSRSIFSLPAHTARSSFVPRFFLQFLPSFVPRPHLSLPPFFLYTPLLTPCPDPHQHSASYYSQHGAESIKRELQNRDLCHDGSSC